VTVGATAARLAALEESRQAGIRSLHETLSGLRDMPAPGAAVMLGEPYHRAEAALAKLVALPKVTTLARGIAVRNAMREALYASRAAWKVADALTTRLEMKQTPPDPQAYRRALAAGAGTAPPAAEVRGPRREAAADTAVPADVRAALDRGLDEEDHEGGGRPHTGDA
jgi:hypothetical protein